MSIANWWSRLADAECLECGGLHSVFQRSCPHCGAVNAARIGAIAIVAALGFLLFAVVATVTMVVRWHWQEQPATETQSQPVTGEPAASAPATPGEFGWLTSAMQQCDGQAEKEQGTLQFLVIPLVADAKDEDDLRKQSLNDIGHGILLSSQTALDGLKRQTLQISKGDYIFSIRDQANAVYSWKRSTGVANFSIANADAITSFHIQFQIGDRALDTEWGNTFVRRRGNCYWVNAVVRN